MISPKGDMISCLPWRPPALSDFFAIPALGDFSAIHDSSSSDSVADMTLYGYPEAPSESTSGLALQPELRFAWIPSIPLQERFHVFTIRIWVSFRDWKAAHIWRKLVLVVEIRETHKTGTQTRPIPYPPREARVG